MSRGQREVKAPALSTPFQCHPVESAKAHATPGGPVGFSASASLQPSACLSRVHPGEVRGTEVAPAHSTGESVVSSSGKSAVAVRSARARPRRAREGVGCGRCGEHPTRLGRGEVRCWAVQSRCGCGAVAGPLVAALRRVAVLMLFAVLSWSRSAVLSRSAILPQSQPKPYTTHSHRTATSSRSSVA